MTPGGIDIIFTAQFPETARRYLLDIVREHWPDCLIEQGMDHEWFLYRTTETRRRWNDGPGDDLSGMVQIIARGNELTVVLDPADAELLHDLRLNIEKNRKKL